MPESTNTNEKITLYRGVSGNHVKFKDALKGIVRPRGGNKTANQHNMGQTDSIYTSWSTERWVAEDWALTDNSEQAVVLEKEFEISELVYSPDFSFESEKLIIGEILDAKVSMITEPETKPVFDPVSQRHKDGGKF